MYLKVAGDLGVDPAECLVFEDIPNGILAGKNAGMEVCAVDDDFSRRDEQEKKRLADYYIHDFYEIMNGTYEKCGVVECVTDFCCEQRRHEKERMGSVDFAYIIGDAYVDHPSFGHAIISRLLESRGIPGGHYLSAGLEGSEERMYLRRASARLPSLFRQYGLHGKSLFRVKEAEEDRRIYARRGDGKAPGPCLRGIWQPDPADV